MGRTYACRGARLCTAALVVLSALGAGTTASADDHHPVKLEDYVAGVPFQQYDLPGPADTPDQGLPPKHVDHSHDAEENRGDYDEEEAEEEQEPIDPQQVEWLPPDEAAAGRLSPYCTPLTGPYQRDVERLLGLRVDGRQSEDDCYAIQRYQQSSDILPDTGFAGPTTFGHLRLDLAIQQGPNAGHQCMTPAKGQRVACVDLTRQILWVQTSASNVVFGPVSMRSGRTGFATRTGRFKVYWRHRDHVSDIYDAPMPFSQFFSGGQALHAITGSVYRAPGSHGCVNLSTPDAGRLWNVLKLHDQVHVFGHKSGT
ncbi:L,D-transpeptidase [Streptomyces sp. NPDC002574]|uniref:L,D-transpeptidase n=1 Tax=Streptomyces sp. NPDC002574 TaxID=3364652 RepID=UPI0036CAD195